MADLADVLTFCSLEDRICPLMGTWGEFWEILPGKYRDPDKQWHPPMPRIFSSWWGSTDRQKRETFMRQLLWAEQTGVLDVADAFLRGLTDDQWHTGTIGRWERSVNAHMSDQWDLRMANGITRHQSRLKRDEERREDAMRHRLERKPSIDARYLSSLPVDLIEAYRTAEYAVFGDPPFSIRIGQACPEIQQLFQDRQISCAAYVTAWNPRSKKQSDALNNSAQALLIRELQSDSLEWITGEGRDENGIWQPEESVLILGISRSRAKRLGHRFKQNAIVWIDADTIPQLIMLMPYMRPPLSA